jgi:hypothetical protein
MHAKVLPFDDHPIADRIMRAVSFGQAIELGRQVRGFREEARLAERVRLIEEANRAKFFALPELSVYLLSTWPAIANAPAVERVPRAHLARHPSAHESHETEFFYTRQSLRVRYSDIDGIEQAERRWPIPTDCDCSGGGGGMMTRGGGR